MHGMKLYDTFAALTKFDGEILLANELFTRTRVAVVLFVQGLAHLLGTEEWALFTKSSSVFNPRYTLKVADPIEYAPLLVGDIVDPSLPLGFEQPRCLTIGEQVHFALGTKQPWSVLFTEQMGTPLLECLVLESQKLTFRN